MQTKVQEAIKCVSVFLYGKISIFSVLLVKASFVELWLPRKSVPLKHAVLTAQEKVFKFYWIVISFEGGREEWDEEKKHCTNIAMLHNLQNNTLKYSATHIFKDLYFFLNTIVVVF